MEANKIAYLILIFISFQCCQQNKISDEKVVGDILPQLIDSLRIHESNVPPPPPNSIINTSVTANDSIISKRIMKEYEQIIERVDSEDSRLLVGISDNSFFIDFEDLSSRNYSDSLLINQITQNYTTRKISITKWNLNHIQIPPDYELILKSNLEEKYSDIWDIKDRRFGGIIAISKVYYNSNSKFGLMQLDNYPFYGDGASYFIIIERIQKEWKVKKILLNWQS